MIQFVFRVSTWLPLSLALVAFARPADAQLRVSTMNPSGDGVVRRMTVKGDVLPWQKTTLRAQVTGVLKNLTWLEGDTIRGVGAEVAVLEVPDLEAEAEKARAVTAAARAAKTEAESEVGVLASEIEQLQAAIPVFSAKELVAGSELAMKQLVAKRKKELASKRAGTVAQAEDADAAVALAVAKVAAAKAETAGARAAVAAARKKMGAIDARVASMASQVEAAKAAEKLAATRIAFATLRNPFDDAVVTMRHADRGDLIKASESPVLTVMDVSKVRVRFGLPERDALRLSPGQEVWMRLQTDPHNPRQVKISRFARMLEKRTRTRWMEVDLDNEDGTLLPNTYVYFDLEFRSQEDAVSLPVQFVIRGRGRPHVLVAEDGQVKRRPVVLGLEGLAASEIDNPKVKKKMDRVAILSGLNKDDQVIKSSVASLSDGDRVVPMLEQGR